MNVNVSHEVIPKPDALTARALAQFRSSFGAEPTCWAQAPGRVNLIGEHTDYNDGFVLPCAINFKTVVLARLRSDRWVNVVAADMNGARDSFHLDQPITLHTDKTWANYVRGMVWALQQAGFPLQGADFAIAGNVPQGAGLSSSASLEVAVGQVFKSMLPLQDVDATRLALLAQRAENEFVDCQCGVMDQLISARGVLGHALLIDCRSLATTPVPLPANMAVLIVHSGITRGLVGSEYNVRREQCEAAAKHFGVAALRDLSLRQLEAGAAGLDPVALRRARHVVSENERTLAAAHALASGDMRLLGRLMAASHASMRDDFEITLPPIDELAALLTHVIGQQGGARMTGGGFGGCVVALLPQALVTEAQAAVAKHYRAPGGASAAMFVCRASAGATGAHWP